MSPTVGRRRRRRRCARRSRPRCVRSRRAARPGRSRRRRARRPGPAAPAPSVLVVWPPIAIGTRPAASSTTASPTATRSSNVMRREVARRTAGEEHRVAGGEAAVDEEPDVPADRVEVHGQVRVVAEQRGDRHVAPASGPVARHPHPSFSPLAHSAPTDQRQPTAFACPAESVRSMRGGDRDGGTADRAASGAGCARWARPPSSPTRIRSSPGSAPTRRSTGSSRGAAGWSPAPPTSRRPSATPSRFSSADRVTQRDRAHAGVRAGPVLGPP